MDEESKLERGSVTPAYLDRLDALYEEWRNLPILNRVTIQFNLSTEVCEAWPAISKALREQAQPSVEPIASSRCPVCGFDTPHGHTEDEVRAWMEAQGKRFGVEVRVLDEKTYTREVAYHESERGRFEAWTKIFPARPWPLHRNEPQQPDHYQNISTQILWDCWSAAAKPIASPAADAPDGLLREIDAFLADAPKGKPHTGYRYGELLAQARDRIAAQDTLIAKFEAGDPAAGILRSMDLVNRQVARIAALEAALAEREQEIARLKE